MKNTFWKKVGLAIIFVASTIYVVMRTVSIARTPSLANVVTGVCEFSLIGLVGVESVLLSSATIKRARKQDDNVLIESAKNVLFSTETQQHAEGSSTTKIQTVKMTAQSYESSPVDAIVFAQDATLEELRRCLLSINLIEDIDHVYVIDASMSPDRKELIEEFNFHITDTFRSIAATTERVLVCRGTDILYPDACAVARTYDVDDDVFLELRSVYSDERELSANGIIDVSDKRQAIREALSTRGLATWSTGPAMVSSRAIEKAAKADSSKSFFLWCERNSIHGVITDEIVSEEISLESTISQVQWRATDLAYSMGAWRNSYKNNNASVYGIFVKMWSLFLSISLLRRMVTIATVLGFVLVPQSFDFVDREYLTVAGVTVAAIFVGGFLTGDRRGPFARIREFYFDVEAVMYLGYKRFLSVAYRNSDRSIVKKLPSVSFLLIMTDAILVYRVFSQYQEKIDTSLTRIAKYGSLFSGYALIVSMLIGLGMVIVRQARTTTRREISRGANINSEPVSMIDLSPGGAGCISVHAMEIGTSVQFESSLPITNENKKFKCEGTVRSCVEWDGTYRIGIEFAEMSQTQKDTLETYCSILFPYSQARHSHQILGSETTKVTKFNGKAEKRFLSYVASFIALGAIIFSNFSQWQ